MIGLITDFTKDVGYEIAAFWNNEFLHLLQICFYMENELGKYVLSSEILNTLTSVSYGIMTILLILKTLVKGSKIYLLNRDGDSDVSPFEILKGYILAICIAVAFPTLYTYLADISLWISGKISQVVGTAAIENYSLFTLISASNSLIDLIMYIVFFIFLITFYFSFFKRGVELFILRIGMPLACIGLIDSDGGVFKPYLQQFFKTALTGIVQMLCINISIAIMVSDNGTSNFLMAMMCSFAFLLAAKSTPMLLNQFLITPAPGGGIQKITSFAMAANCVRGFVK